jgi:hypothetical protein
VFRARRGSLVYIREPLVLISQLQRSGGTLVNSLMDGHPELHAHPYEVHIGHPTKHDWPELPLDAGAEAWMATLREPQLRRLFYRGYRKTGDRSATLEDFPALPFLFVPSFVERLFLVLCADEEVTRSRDILDRYFTAFFNGWLDCNGLRESHKRWIAGFGPRLAWNPSRDQFFRDYPDGRLICVLRDPRGWWASASQFSAQYADIDESLGLWERNAAELEQAKRDRPDAVRLITYEALTTDHERVMRSLADWLGIGWDPILLRPTFNRVSAVRPNSSHGAMEPTVRSESRERWRETLPEEVADQIEARCEDRYRQVRGAADFG